MKNLTDPLAGADAKQPASIKNTDTARVFFALWPKATIQRRLHGVAKEYQAKCNARVMRADTLHMTLQFIGNIKRSQLPKLITAADKVSAPPPFKLKLNKLSFWKHNRIGYATLTVSEPPLDKLAATMQYELANEGFIADSAKFSPHVTLLRNVEHILAAQNFMPVTWQVDSFVLVESVTIQQRTQYRILREWPFANLRT
ncbi:MAG TPA: RNA 2',3'-cyclic phosphodiesterase [Methylotenera sp.]|nr:RNA 2',3'-cyclic phosphodiesterase [Methylotenera sp.]